MTPEELVAEACPLLANIGSAFYFSEATLARGKEVGLDGFRLYFLGRGGVLGDVEPAVVQSAFGYFEPGLVAKTWTSGRERSSLGPREVGRLYVEACREFGRSTLSGIEGLDAFCDAASTVVARTDPAGLALYAALASEPLPADTPARAMQLAAVLRELRGSVHLVAVVAHGVSPRVIHYYRRPADYKLFGYAEGTEPELTGDDRAAIAKVDALTDLRMAEIFAVLSDRQRESLATGTKAIAATLA